MQQIFTFRSRGFVLCRGRVSRRGRMELAASCALANEPEKTGVIDRRGVSGDRRLRVEEQGNAIKL